MYEETLRIDPSGHLWGQRTNFWVAAAVFIASTTFFIYWQWVRDPSEKEHQPKPRKRKEPPRKRETMAIPRGRVR
jgi:predicted MFS family arabinose efflux permease